MADMVLAPQRQWVRKSSLREASEASFRDGALAPDPESRDSGFDAEPVIGPRFARTRWHRPGMTVAGCSFPAMTRKRPNLLTALRVSRSGRERAAVLFLGGGRDEGLGAGRVDQMMPDHRPGADEVALAGGPGKCRVEAEPADREGQAELGILLEEVGDLVAGEIDHDQIG